ncbi:calpastatin [Aureimonas ureilytica]|uniref:Calpastatin n=1 Tax=Aureimonas ureilytica TaxID=401562 RepID=A0A175RKZ0_9HYPH|nr:DUF1810 domain-containing protein [Aureimonas ureilytica]KTR04081.1 calpastatin [Aureimonas ureilytica]
MSGASPEADPFDLGRFLSAQETTQARALAELRRGRKESHWMWFVFPQLAGLGRSETARHYAIRSLAEARAYLAHPVLGPRLREAVAAAMASGVASPRALFGSPDDMKLRSSLTLFREAAEGNEAQAFEEALARFFGGEADEETLKRLG